jgi:hypothetical protein
MQQQYADFIIVILLALLFDDSRNVSPVQVSSRIEKCLSPHALQVRGQQGGDAG